MSPPKENMLLVGNPCKTRVFRFFIVRK